jgi:RNA polymerase sigma factor (sigma-70 family)
MWSVIRLRETRGGSADPAEGADQREDLSRALGHLSPEDRAAVFLHSYEDMSSAAVGETLGISASAVRSRLHRAPGKVRVDLAEEEL